jgi:hypothetical protein
LSANPEARSSQHSKPGSELELTRLSNRPGA